MHWALLALSLVSELPSAEGPNGLLRTPSAMPSKPWTVRTALFVDWFRASSFLCTTERPCGTATTDEHRHTGVTWALGATLLRGLDAYLTTRAYSNDNSRSPELHEVIGDTTVGARYANALAPALFVGGGAEALFVGAPGTVGLGGGGTSARARLFSTFAGDALAKSLPFRVHLGLAYLLDNTGVLVRDVERERGVPITRVERYGLGINKVDRVTASLGAELLAGHVRPFVEYGLAIPVRRNSSACPSDEPCRASVAAMPSQVTFGARVAPYDSEVGAVSFLIALDLGLTSRFAGEVAPNAPYTLWLGLALSTLAKDRPPKVVVERVEVEVPPPFVTMRGLVHVAGSKTPIANAIVTFVDLARPPLATDSKGEFGDEVPPGTYEVKVHADGYKDNTCGGTAVAAGKSELRLDCPLEPAAPATGE